MSEEKITYTDERGVEHELKEKNKKNKKSSKNIWFFVLMVFLALVMGIVGSVGSLLILSGNEQLQEKLGISSINIPLTTTEKIKLEESSAITETVDKVTPAVVSITTTQSYVDFFGQVVQQEGGGTGFIITSDGLIVTNKHVVEDENAQYKVIMSDGKDYDASIVAKDPYNDLAVLDIEADGLSTVQLGNSDDLKIGQWVVAVGNALGEFSNTVTVGVLSARERQITAANGVNAETLENLLQTDAAINPGNSGGPLVNLSGQVIGINTAVAGGAENIGFAIPINTVKKAIDSVKETGEIKRPMLGVRYVQITSEIAEANSLEYDYGAWILPGTDRAQAAVIPGSPADKAGLVENDIILEIDGTRIDENKSLGNIINNYDIGDEVTLKVYHKGDVKDVKVKLEEMK